MPDLSLESRLLCACNCAYSIAHADGTYTPPADYDPFVGWTAPPVAISGGPLNVNAALVGTIPGGVVVAFRGTLSEGVEDHASLYDWLRNFQAEQTIAKDIPGRVHAGFWSDFLTIRDDVGDAVNSLKSSGSLFITGHSKGGALAHLASAWFANRGYPSHVVTFGAPRVGDRDFSRASQPTIRYEFGNDIVPHVPIEGALWDILCSELGAPTFASVLDYHATGVLRYIDRDGQTLVDSVNLQIKRGARLLAALRNVQELAGQHSITRGSGYWIGVHGID